MPTHTFAFRRSAALGWALGASLFAAGLARAAVDVQVDPDTAAVGQPVAIFGSSNCAFITVDFGDGSPPETIPGPGPYATVHTYAEPGVVLVIARGDDCADTIDSQVSTLVITPGAPSGPGAPPPPPISGAEAVAIERIALRFTNERPAIRVRQNETGVQVFADVRFRGTGLLQGYWEVDGRIWAFFNRHVAFGQTVTIASPSVPGLPTIDPGLHRVRFVLTRPAAAYAPPLALYFAGYEEAVPALQLHLVRPLHSSLLNAASGASPRFEWAASADVAAYRLSFLSRDGRTQVFGAFTRSDSYTLPARLLAERFTQGEYQWQVIAYDDEGRELGRSLRRSFAVEFSDPAVAGR